MALLSFRLLDFLALVVALAIFRVLARRLRWRSIATPLRGPPRPSFFYGAQRELLQKHPSDIAKLYEQWTAEYGGIFSIPWSFGTGKIIITDPKAVAHFYARETYTYVQSSLGRNAIANLFGKGILWAEGDVHKRQRKALTPAFSNAAIRRLTSIFYESTYKLKTYWDNIIQSASSTDGSTVIEVQGWMNRIAYDSVGIGGFSFDFGTLDGKPAVVGKAIDDFGQKSGGKPMVSPLMFMLAPVLPFLLNLPIKRTRMVREVKKNLSVIGKDLLDRMRREKVTGAHDDLAAEKSVIGLLIKSEDENTDLRMSEEEIMAQMNTLLLAGYITTSISLTWALIQLSKHKDKQEKLREELSQFTIIDPTYEQLTSGLPYLDAVVHEVLRLHPPLAETNRECVQDDVVPLSTPMTTANGEVVTSVTIPKGSFVTVPIRMMNTSEALWGPTAQEFLPERWLKSEGGGEFAGLGASTIQGHRHLLTFSDGPRICLGKAFAITEFKAALSVLIRNYAFEFPDGPDTPLGIFTSILPRPKVEGTEGFSVPLLVRKVE